MSVPERRDLAPPRLRGSPILPQGRVQGPVQDAGAKHQCQGKHLEAHLT